MTPIFSGKVEYGKLKLDSPDDLKRYISSLKGDVELSIKRKTKRISNPELRYYYGVIVKILSNELGYTRDEMDMALKYKFCRKFDSKGLLILPSKTDFTTVYTEALFDEIRIWALTELNINIPLPGQITED